MASNIYDPALARGTTNLTASVGWVLPLMRWMGWHRRQHRPVDVRSGNATTATWTVGWTPLSTLGGVVVASVLLADRVVPIVSPERYPDRTIILLIFASAMAVLGGTVIGCVSLFRLARGTLAAVAPLFTLLVAAAIPVLPLDPMVRDLDDHLHRNARQELVRRLETGELATPEWRSVPPGHLVEAPQTGRLLIPIPPEFSAAVSNAAGQGLLTAHLDPALTRVVFEPHGGIGNRLWAVVYDRGDIAPEADDPTVVSWRIQHVERLRDNWYRVVAE